MFKASILFSEGGKHYIALRAEAPTTFHIEIKSGEIQEFYVLPLQKKKTFFILHPAAGASEVSFLAEVPIVADVYAAKRRRPLKLKLLELWDDFRRRRASLWPEIRTETGVHMREITLGEFMPGAYSRSERLLFHRCRLASAVHDRNEKDEWRSVLFSENVLSDLLAALGTDDCREFLFFADAGKFTPENRSAVSRFVAQLFGNPATAIGPAWDLMRSNIGVGMVYWSGEVEKTAPRYFSRATRKLASLMDVDIPDLEACIDLPPLFLVRRSALSWISSMNIESIDIQNGLRDVHSLRRLLPALVKKAGFMFAALPDPFDAGKAGKSVELARWVCFRPAIGVNGADICLFVGLLDSGNSFSEHALQYMLALKAQGLYVYALAASIGEPEFAQDPGPEFCDAFAARANDGHDFGLWAAAIKRTPEVWNANSLLFANDSMVPSSGSLGPLFEQLKKSPFDVTGLTEGKFAHKHIQSYFVRLNRKALQTPEVQRFWGSVLSWRDKARIISLYEIGMTSKFSAAGLSCGALYELKGNAEKTKFNPTLDGWKALITLGFPFVKTQIIKQTIGTESAEEVFDFLESNGFSRDSLMREFLKESIALTADLPQNMGK